MKKVVEITKKGTAILSKEYTLRAVKRNGANKYEVVKELIFNSHPSDIQIAMFLDLTDADFVSCIENYRLLDDSEMPEEDYW